MDKIKITDRNEISTIITQDYNKFSIVEGFPGTGKTYILIKRIEHLVNIQKLDPNKGILVLSFSRNAVREIKSRIINDTKLPHEFINVLTFDKFAAKLLKNTRTDDRAQFIFGNHDTSIKAACDLLKNTEIKTTKKIKHTIENWPELNEIKHILIDEIQDLNCARASLVKELFLFLEEVSSHDWGFTLLGDMNQEIFAYFASRPENSEYEYKRSSQIIFYIRNKFKPTDFLLNISNKRFETMSDCNVPPIITKISEYMEKNQNNFKITENELYENIINLLPSIPVGDPKIENLEKLIETIQPYLNNGSKSAILTRNEFLIPKDKYNRPIINNTNYTYESSKVLSIGLFRKKFVHQLLTSEHNVLPNWIARLLLTSSLIENGKIQKNVFILKWDKNLEERTNMTSEKAWRAFNYLANGQVYEEHEYILHKNLIKNLINNFDESKLENYGYLNSNILLSDIHKSKGREYDNVFLFKFSLAEKKREELLEEARVYYVAATRARQNFYLLNFVWHFNPARKEELIQHVQKKENVNQIFLLDSDCVDKDTFITKENISSKTRQDHIWNSLKINDDVEIVPKKGKCAEIYHNNVLIGNLNEDISKSIINWYEKYEIPLHNRLKGAKIIALTTEIFDNYLINEIGQVGKIPNEYREIGCCLGFRIMGACYVK